jgi:hypothetical protein
MNAAQVAERWSHGGISRADTARLAERAAADQQPSDFIGAWPTSIAQADELIRRTGLARDLLQLRDALATRSA